MNTCRFMKANGLKSQTIEKAFLCLSLTTFCQIFVWTHAGKIGEEYEPATIIFSVFSGAYTAILFWEEISIQHTQGQWVWKMEKSSSGEAQLTKLKVVHGHGKGDKLQATQAIDKTLL